MEVNFCRRCGWPVTQSQPGKYQCPLGHTLFYKAYPSSCAVLLNSKNEVLVAIRAQNPGKGTVDLPGGFLETHETYQQGLARELKEETGLMPADYTPLQFLCDAVDDYVYQGETQPAHGVAFWGRVHKDIQPKASDDVAELLWMPLDDIDFNSILPGFHCVRKALALMRKRQDNN